MPLADGFTHYRIPGCAMLKLDRRVGERAALPFVRDKVVRLRSLAVEFHDSDFLGAAGRELKRRYRQRVGLRMAIPAKVDLVYLAHGRQEFTQASLQELLANTPAGLLGRIHLFLDGGRLPALPPGGAALASAGFRIHPERIGGPVAIMNRMLDLEGSEIFAKIDNDVIVPPGWLEACAAVMNSMKHLDLLGIEPPASRTPAKPGGRRVPQPEISGPIYRAFGCPFGYAPATSIGGIGLMRRTAFAKGPRMQPLGFRGVGGFNTWQLERREVTKGWIVPPLRVFLLDRLPIQPWLALSESYIASGLQRPWTRYSPADRALWEWWNPARAGI